VTNLLLLLADYVAMCECLGPLDFDNFYEGYIGYGKSAEHRHGRPMTGEQARRDQGVSAPHAA